MKGHTDVVNEQSADCAVTMRTFPGIAIIILNWNGWQDTLACLESVCGLNYPDYLTIVVDNGSWDDSVEEIKAWVRNRGEGFSFVHYTGDAALKGGDNTKEQILDAASPEARMVLITNRENLGFAGGNNVAINYSLHRNRPADYVFLLNNDAVVEKDCLSRMMRAAHESGAGIVGVGAMGENGDQIQWGKENSVKKQFFVPLVNNLLPPHEMQKVYWHSLWVGGGAMLIHAGVLTAVLRRRGSYFDPDLFLYWEDVEFCILAGIEGYESVIAREARIHCREAGSSGGRYNPLAYYYNTRNRMLSANNLLPWQWKIVFHIVNFVMGIGRIFKMIARRRYVSAQAICRGLIDGYKGVKGKWRQHDHVVLQQRGSE
ncbi:MAG: glycosyltransferase family 2 protein [Nitrospiraceae bacterium]|nr:glycosyltransferase family 2 protein [Nitrospiraceae bacterium]